jgi:hypothetical protein
MLLRCTMPHIILANKTHSVYFNYLCINIYENAKSDDNEHLAAKSKFTNPNITFI